MANLQGLKCWYCGREADTRDHVKPRIRGGKGGIKNIVPACAQCNSVKSNMTKEEFRTALKRWDAEHCQKPQQWNILRVLRPWGFVFYGERGVVDATYPAPCQSRSKSRWKKKARRNEGPMAVRIEEAAKTGRPGILAGLMNGS